MEGKSVKCDSCLCDAPLRVFHERLALGIMTSELEKPKELIEYRAYLHLLARRHLSARYHGKLDCSDIVQQTLVHAISASEQYNGKTEAERLAWLRQILVRNVSHATRDLHTKKRDIDRELRIQNEIDASSLRLERLLLDYQSSPSQKIVKKDLLRVLAAAIENLPEDQRRVIVLRYWEDRSLNEIGVDLNKSLAAVAGLLHRATKKLRNVLSMSE